MSSDRHTVRGAGNRRRGRMVRRNKRSACAVAPMRAATHSRIAGRFYQQAAYRAVGGTLRPRGYSKTTYRIGGTGAIRQPHKNPIADNRPVSLCRNPRKPLQTYRPVSFFFALGFLIPAFRLRPRQRQHHDLGFGAHPQRRSPGPRARRHGQRHAVMLGQSVVGGVHAARQ